MRPLIRVSIIIPCFNRQDLLGATLDSVRAQTFGDWEAIIVDDHSQDNSVQVAQSYAQSDGRIRVVSRQGQRKGGNVCRNEGLALARGDYVIFLDSDDLLSEECLEHRVAAMNLAPDCGFGVFQTELFTQTIGDRGLLWNAFLNANDLHRFLSLDTVWLVTAPIWRKPTLEKLGGFDEEVLSFQDWELHTRALIAGIKYFKKPTRDSFHRFEYLGGNTITAIKDSRPDHLNSHKKLFRRTLNDLRAAGLLDSETRGRVAGMFWWLATNWQLQNNLKAADRIWYEAVALGLCGFRHFLGGYLILRLKAMGRGAPVVRLIQRSWPPHCIVPTWDCLCKTPVGFAEAATASSQLSPTTRSSIQAGGHLIL